MGWPSHAPVCALIGCDFGATQPDDGSDLGIDGDLCEPFGGAGFREDRTVHGSSTSISADKPLAGVGLSTPWEATGAPVESGVSPVIARGRSG